jgi:hypothetical protein
MPNIINIALTDTFEQWRVKDNEVGAALGDVATLNLGGVTGDETVISSLNELRIDTTNQAGWIGNISTLYGSNIDLTSAINDNKADIDTLATTAGIDLLTSSLTGYNGTETAAVEIFNAHFARLESNDTNITTINTNIGNNNTDISNINTDVGTWSNYTGAEADITAALNAIHAIHLSDPHTYVGVAGDTMTGKLVADGGIGATTSLTLGVGAGTAITVNDQQRLGIGISPHATYKVDVNGQLNATTLSVGGESTDDRYIRNASGGGTAEISAAIEHTGTTTFSEDITIGTELVYDHSAFTFSEYISDRVGDAFTSNTESGGITAVYDDATNKITLAIADDGHSHVVGNIDNFTEEVQDVVGGMVSTNSESGIEVTYDDIDGKLNFNVNDPTVTLTGAVTGSATMANLGSISIATTTGTNSIPTTSITALEEYIQDVIGAMITGNTETGMAVTYNDTTGKINFDNTLAVYDVNGTQVF